MKSAGCSTSAILVVRVGAPLDPDGSSLRGLLQHELDYEHARVTWWRWWWIFAVATCVRWLVWPQLASLLPVAMRSIAMSMWLLVSMRATVAAAFAWYRARRWDEALTDHPAATVRSPSA